MTLSGNNVIPFLWVNVDLALYGFFADNNSHLKDSPFNPSILF